jgi:RNA polymerase sigma factor (sigma-70 family)
MLMRMTANDLELVGAFARDQSQDAFTALVQRHLDLVYCAALRQVRSPQLAEEVAQSVFTDLARNAARLKPNTILAAWLYEVTRRTAIDVVRGEARRQLREQVASELNDMNAPAADWTHIEPLLDEAMHALDEPDRTAVLLSYFENKSLREVGEFLGVSGDAARKRISRAVERLREFLAKRGVTVGASGLVAVASANAVQAAPVGLVVTISTAAVGAGTTLTTTATATATKAIVMTATQKVLVATILVAAIGTGIYEARQASTLRKQVSALKQSTDLNEQLTSNGDDAARQLAALRAENERLRGNTAELLRLRGEVAGLRREAAKVGSLESELAKVRSAAAEQIPPGASKLIISNPYLAREAWSDKGMDTPYHAFETMLWAGMTENAQRLAEVTIPGDKSVLLEDRPPLRKIKGVQIVSVDGGSSGVTRIGAIVEDEFYGGGLDKPPGTVQNIRSWYLIRTNGGWKVTGGEHSW